MDLLSWRRYLSIMLLSWATTSVIGQLESLNDKKLGNSTLLETSKRKGYTSKPLRSGQLLRSGPRGRRKNIWSYNLGHRSLAFLVAGEVEVGTPPSFSLDPGSEYHCHGCCEAETTPTGRRIAEPDVPNTILRSIYRKEELSRIGTEPNSVADRCLGCCVFPVTPTPAPARRTMPGITAGMDVALRRQTPDQPWTRQTLPERRPGTSCNRHGCPPDWSSESSSSSEEDFREMRNQRASRRRPPLRHRPGDACRFLGCRSPLGFYSDSSSEED
ncbi:Hypothetical predicted protein [Pelobates cultripes]|uniref:Uncharacterized protein n=1 Tax=Pelobates cultripes TaxID=61616 RepID=A0AAD1W386_PELCU|nr:Hypothetical predicted protein [Pelobates cultripes]